MIRVVKSRKLRFSEFKATQVGAGLTPCCSRPWFLSLIQDLSSTFKASEQTVLILAILYGPSSLLRHISPLLGCTSQWLTHYLLPLQGRGSVSSQVLITPSAEQALNPGQSPRNHVGSFSYNPHPGLKNQRQGPQGGTANPSLVPRSPVRQAGSCWGHAGPPGR